MIFLIFKMLRNPLLHCIFNNNDFKIALNNNQYKSLYKDNVVDFANKIIIELVIFKYSLRL